MGTGGSVPQWVGDIQLMEQFGWTERELFEEVSLGTVANISKLNEMRAKADAVKGRRAARPSTSGEEVVRWDADTGG